MTDIRFLNPITVLSDIGGISIDITTRVGEVYDNIITKNPIEDGSPTTDHIINLPPKLTIEGGFSDIRMTNLVGAAMNPLFARKGLAKEQFDRLLELSVSRETFNVMDGFHLFKDMQFKNIQLQKDRPGFSIFFTAELWGIRKVNINSTVTDTITEINAFNRLKVVPKLLLNVGTVSTSASLQSIGVLA